MTDGLALRQFAFQTTATIWYAPGAMCRYAAALQARLGAEILIVTDPGLVALGFVGTLQDALRDAGARVRVYCEVIADPPHHIVEEAAQTARGASGVIGLGGGSSLDVAKLAAVLAAGDQPLSEIYGVDQVRGGRLPLALIPTTAGTGSEVTPVAIVTTGTREKMGVVSPCLIPDIALLDPELTRGLPPDVTAATGIDAMVHAIEAYASKNANNNPISQLLAKEALRLLGGAIERAVHAGEDIEARGDMLLGAMFAGQAFANAPVAAVHALAYPLGGHFKISHGLSNALVLPHVLRFNADCAADVYNTLAPCVFPELTGYSPQAGAAAFADALAQLAARCGLPTQLHALNIAQEDLPALAKDAMNQTRLLVNNPKTLRYEDALHIYQEAW